MQHTANMTLYIIKPCHLTIPKQFSFTGILLLKIQLLFSFNQILSHHAQVCTFSTWLPYIFYTILIIIILTYNGEKKQERDREIYHINKTIYCKQRQLANQERLFESRDHHNAKMDVYQPRSPAHQNLSNLWGIVLIFGKYL